MRPRGGPIRRIGEPIAQELKSPQSAVVVMSIETILLTIGPLFATVWAVSTVIVVQVRRDVQRNA